MIDRLVLALDGSTRTCSAALLRRRTPAMAAGVPGPQGGDRGWQVVARRAEKDGRGQARVLLSMVDEMLEEVGGGPAQLGAVVVGTGPGTFTGVRITVATGRALSLALAVPVLGVSTLAALAVRGLLARGASPLVVPVVDARRDQVFYGVYEASGETVVAEAASELTASDGAASAGATEGHPSPRWARRGEFGVCDRGALADILAGPALIVAEEASVVGGVPSGAVVVASDVEAEELVVGQSLLEEPEGGPHGWRLGSWLSAALDAGSRASLGAAMSGHGPPGGVGTPESVRPIYVRSPDADVHITKMRDPWAADSVRRDHPGAG